MSCKECWQYEKCEPPFDYDEGEGCQFFNKEKPTENEATARAMLDEYNIVVNNIISDVDPT